MSTRALWISIPLLTGLGCGTSTGDLRAVSVAELAADDEPAPPPEVPTIPLAPDPARDAKGAVSSGG